MLLPKPHIAGAIWHLYQVVSRPDATGQCVRSAAAGLGASDCAPASGAIGSRGGGSSSSSRVGCPREEDSDTFGMSVNRGALALFYEHADSTNDVFRLTAKVVAHTLLAAERRLHQQQLEQRGGAWTPEQVGRLL